MPDYDAVRDVNLGLRGGESMGWVMLLAVTLIIMVLTGFLTPIWG